MDAKRMSAPGSTIDSVSPRRHFAISSMAVRVLIALVISWLIVMAFFVTHVVSP